MIRKTFRPTEEMPYLRFSLEEPYTNGIVPMDLDDWLALKTIAVGSQYKIDPLADFDHKTLENCDFVDALNVVQPWPWWYAAAVQMELC